MKNVIAQKRIVLISLIVLFFLAIVVGYLVFSKSNQLEDLPVRQAAPQFSMNDMNGKSMTFEENAKVKLVYFFFASCPDACPISTQILKGVQDQLKTKKIFEKDVEMFSISIDPIRDTPEVLEKYAEMFGADDKGWHFLRPDTPEEVRIVSEGFGTGVLNEDDQMIHADLIILVDKNNQIREYYHNAEVETILKGIQSLL